MATAANSAEGFLTSKAGRALAFGCSFTVCLLAAGVLSITLLGHPAGPAAVFLDLADKTANKPKPAIVPSADSNKGLVAEAVSHPVYAGGNLVADPALIENSVQGPLPRIADDGRKPMTVYAVPAPANAKFKIAILVNGLGQSATATKTALDALPANVTLGFVPYASDAAEWVSKARERGHEVLLQIPMEPLDFPDSDIGPNTLRSGQEEEANIQRLSWALSRFTGMPASPICWASASSPTARLCLRFSPISTGAVFISSTMARPASRWCRWWRARSEFQRRKAGRRWTPFRIQRRSTAACRNWKPRPAPMAARWVRRSFIPQRWRESPSGPKDCSHEALFSFLFPP